MDSAPPPSGMREILELVSHSHAPMMVLQVPSLVITAASQSAHKLLNPRGQPLIGRNLMDFLEGDPSGAMPLLAAGRLTGYETIRALKLTGQRRRVWVRAVPDTGPTRVAIAVLSREDTTERAFVPWKDDDAGSPVIGSIDAQLMIDRVSGEVYESFGYFVEEIIGRSFLSLIVPEDIAEVLLALSRTSKHEEGVTLRVGIVGAVLVPVRCQLVLLPLRPAPSCAFALLREDSHGSADGRAIADLITRLSRGIRGGMTSQTISSAPIRSDVDLRQLSGRELEIVTRLMSGDRVPAIARQLFLSEGTVRNHLSSVFGKLGVGTQQELIERLRPRPRSG
jgi:DNA-binding CsgD family transcriptional regulator/PAS domain-containing protein